MKKKKQLRPTCQHLNWDNKHDCKNKAEYVCMCCNEPVCAEHKKRECPYGGMGYIEIEF